MVAGIVVPWKSHDCNVQPWVWNVDVNSYSTTLYLPSTMLQIHHSYSALDPKMKRVMVMNFVEPTVAMWIHLWCNKYLRWNEENRAYYNNSQISTKIWFWACNSIYWSFGNDNITRGVQHFKFKINFVSCLWVDGRRDKCDKNLAGGT